MSKCEFNTATQLRLQQIEREIVSVIDSFCAEHNIKYSLAYGSMLGAVRHKGFIPWDDDMDLFMTRCDYDRFIAEWQKNPPRGYVLQNNDIEPTFKQSFTKIHKNGTIFLTEEAVNQPYHHGIKVDIFPIDAIPNNRFMRMVQRFNALFAMLYTRGYVTKANGRLMYYVGGTILKCTPAKMQQRLKKYFQRQQTKFNNTSHTHYCCFDVLADFFVKYPKEWIDETMSMPFDDFRFNCYTNTDGMLTLIYGNYMEYPPKEEQSWTHHPIEISFDESYPSDKKFIK